MSGGVSNDRRASGMRSRARAVACWTLASITMVVGACGRQDGGGAVPAAPAMSARAPERSPAPSTPAASPDAAAIAANNRGVGLMGQFEFEKAQAAFEEALARNPAWADVTINRAIAVLNQTADGRQQEAIAILDPVLKAQPENLRARYATALCRLFLGEPEQALVHFGQVARSDPLDAYAAYYHGQCLELTGDAGAALLEYRRAAEIDPSLRSAFLGMQRCLQRAGKEADAAAALETFMKLADNPRARLAEFKYTRMGSKGEAIAVPIGDAPSAAPVGPIFAAARALVEPPAGWTWSTSAMPRSITVADIDGDERLDLFVTAALRNAGGAVVNAVILQQAGGGFRVDPEHALAAVRAVEAALWGDVDNDGTTDVVLCSRGGTRLWTRGQSGWTDSTAGTRVFAGAPASNGLLADLDHDGDLDCLLVAGGQGGREAQFLVNLDGLAFKDITAGVIPADVSVGQAVAGDFDGDRDLDLFLRGHGTRSVLLRNDRLWSWAPWDAANPVLANQAAVAAAAGDADGDGTIDLVLQSEGGALSAIAFPQRGDGGDVAERPLDAALPSGEGFALTDLRGDGVLRPFAPATEGSAPAPRGWALAALSALRGPSLVSIDDRGGLLIADPGEGRFDFSSLLLRGRLDPGQSMRSNSSGIGTLVNARIDSRWATRAAMPTASTRGQSLEPMAIGLGSAPRIDFVSLDWSDGVFQSELDIAPGGPHLIVETQRQISSCPLLFAWDGTTHRFVSDLLGVGGLGYLVAPGEYAPPRPWEFFLLPEGLPASRDGELELLLHEPMEETVYLDAIVLHAIDVPAGWQVVLDERLALAGPEPTGDAVFMRDVRVPVEASIAWDDSEAACTGAITTADLDAAPLGPVDTRHIGRLGSEHVLTLTFDAPLAGATGTTPVLVVDGWVEYPYSQTTFAAWQAGATFDAPTLEARDGDGTWHVLLPGFGYPAGMPRTMSVPLPALPAECTALRLRTNLEIHWDRVGVGFAEPCPDVERLALAPATADLRVSGFPWRSDAPGRRPVYDYRQRAPLADMKVQVGLYTRLGDVVELLAAEDGALAIFGPGEEIAMRFAEPAPVRPGFTRRYVLEARGWCKDMDLFTDDGDTVAPIPGTRDDRAEALHQRLNTRFGGGR